MRGFRTKPSLSSQVGFWLSNFVVYIVSLDPAAPQEANDSYARIELIN